MTDNQREPSNTTERPTTGLVAKLNAGWRALSAAYARLTPPTPPITDGGNRPHKDDL